MEHNYLQTRMGRLLIVRAGEQDAESVIAVMRDAAQWLRSRGIDQWGWAFTEKGAELIHQRIQREEVYLAVYEGQRVATVCLQWQDKLIWDERGEDGQAGYVHGLAIMRRAGGQGVGQQLLAWAEVQIAARGRSLARLDCMADNPGLCAYYRCQGYRDLGVKHFRTTAARLFEKPIGTSPATG